jgi:hypothetical protein
MMIFLGMFGKYIDHDSEAATFPKGWFQGLWCALGSCEIWLLTAN